MPISTNGAIITRVAGALYGEYLSNASYNELVGVSTISPASIAGTWLSNDFAMKTDAQIATTVLTNLGLTSIAGLNNWLAAQLTAAGSTSAAKGAKLVDLLNGYANMTTDAVYGTYATSFNAKVDASLAKSQTAGAKGGSFLTADVVAITNAALTLTTGVDTTLVGGAGSDTYTASGTTLTAGDQLSGGAGADTLQITTTAAAAVGTGVTSTGVETISATATLGDLSVDATGFSDVTTITNTGSTANVSVTGLKAIPAVNVVGTATATSVAFASATTTNGAADSITVNLNGAAVTGNGSVTANGIETVNVVSTGSASGSTTATFTVTSDALTALAVTGSAAAKIAANLVGATATTTGTVTSDDGAHDIAITADATDKLSINLGAGNDQLRVANISATHTIAGGDGTDTLRYSGADAVALAGTANVTGFESVTLSNAAPASFAMTGAGVTTLTYTEAGAGTFGGLSTGGTVNLNKGGSVTVAAAGATAGATAAATLAAATYSGTADSLTVNVGAATTTTGAASSTVSAVGVESVTFNSLALSTSTEARAVTFSDTTATTAALKSITVNSSIPALTTVAVSNAGTSALTTVNLSGVTGGASFTGGATAGTTITGGVGNDALTGGAGPDNISGGEGNDTINGAAGADTIDAGNGTNNITGGAGADTMTGGTGVDTYVFVSNNTTASTPVITSTTSAPDTITNFTSGVDKISVSGTYAVTKFLGNFTNIQAALSAQAGVNGQAFAAAYVTGENTLYVFQNTNGLLHVDDLAVKMTGVTALADSDFFLGSIAGGNSITLTGTGGGSVTTTASTSFATETNPGTNLPAGSVLTTSANDVITANISAIPSATTLTGGTGSDTLALTFTAGAAAYTLPATVTEFEVITLANVAATATATNALSVTLSAGNVAANTILSVTNNHVATAFDGTLTATGTTFTGTNALDTSSKRLSYTGSAGHESVTGGAGNDTISGGDGNDTLVAGAGNDSLSGGAGNDTFVLSTNLTSGDIILGGTGVADVLTFTNPAAAAATMLDNVTGVETLTYTSVTAANAANMLALNVLTPTALSAFAADTAVRVFTQANFNSTVDFTNVTGGSISYTGGTTADAITGSNTLADTLISGGGADTISGGGGNDTISVGTAAAASTSFNGGAGDDTFVMGTTMLTAATIDGGTGIDTITFTDATNTTSDIANVTNVEVITLGAAVTAIVGVDANIAAGATLTIDATAATSLSYSTTETNGNLSIVGSAGADTISGGDGNDTINGGAGDDASINGGAGNDLLTGGEGADVFLPGTGNDTIVLTETTAAIDTVKFAEGGASNVDTITGFNVANDIISIAVAAVAVPAGFGLTNPTPSGGGGVAITANTTQVLVNAAASSGTVNASGANNIVKFTTGATSFAGAIGTTSVTLTGFTGVEAAPVIWFDSSTSQAVIGLVNPNGDGSAASITINDQFVEIVRVGMTSADYGNFVIGNLTFY